jgi:hypothetical protein
MRSKFFLAVRNKVFEIRFSALPLLGLSCHISKEGAGNGFPSARRHASRMTSTFIARRSFVEGIPNILNDFSSVR